ncbi:MAG: hypothetical protein HOK80_08435 [Candidatus Cloacimonetes bacterium]|nr:hypothetical protein [Candidatus Cloacimonadota bacterium]
MDCSKTVRVSCVKVEKVVKAINLCGEARLTVGIHLILGIPNETFNDMLQTIKWVSYNKYIKQVKFHNLVVYKNTKLAKIEDISCYSIEDHIINLGKLIPYLRGDITVSRLFTSNIRRTQIAVDEYKGNKTQWMNSLRKYLYKNKLNQGDKTDVKYNYREYY